MKFYNKNIIKVENYKSFYIKKINKMEKNNLSYPCDD
jgi:hypothetical protein